MRKPPVLQRARRAVRVRRFRGSAGYWQDRYASGGNSGSGSYGKVADFKAGVLNEFVRGHDVTSVVELGCGDGNQLSLADYPSYLGVDVARSAVEACRTRFAADPTKRFLTADESAGSRGDLAISLDVILHLVEDDVFGQYMQTLFESAERYVGIFAENLPDERLEAHVRYRPFLAWIARQQPGWELIQTVDNPYYGSPEDTLAHFYFFARIG
jgi:SAM-dependent methyltransferase